MSELTRAQAEALARWIHEAVRPDWDVSGIVAALGEAKGKGTAATVAVAAIVAADTPANRTPGVIPLAGPHWPKTGRKHAPPPPRHKTCGVCYRGYDECRRVWADDHEFESIPDARARKIAAADVPPKVRPPAPYMSGRPVRDVELP